MHCTECGFDNIEGAATCAQCGVPLPTVRSADHNDAPKERKVIKLASDSSDDTTRPIDRPWEVRVPRRNTDDPGNSGRIRSSRRRSGNTGKIPAIQRPSSLESSGEILKKPIDDLDTGNEERRKAVSGASIGGAAADTLILKPAPANGESRPAPTPRRISRGGNISVGSYKKNGNGKKIGIVLAALIVFCAIIAGVFIATSGPADKVITFETNGGSSIAQQHMIEGGKLVRPTNPKKNGYTFVGWYLDASLSEPATFPLIVNKDMTLYAKWVAEKTDGSSTTPSTSDVPIAPAETPVDQPTSSGSNYTGGSSGNGSSGGSNGGGSGSTSKPSKPSSGGGNGGGNGNNDGGNGGGTVPDDPSTATVTVVTTSGQTLSGTVHLTDGYVIPNSSEKAYTIDELRALNLNPAELSIARNEIYARLGYDFSNSGLQAYFDARPWYHNSGTKPELVQGSAGWITAHNLRALSEESAAARKWLSLRMS